MSADRHALRATLRAALEPHDWVHALLEAGSAAFGRDDELSDVDLLLEVDDDRVEDAFALVEHALETLAPIEVTLRIPPPTFHGYAQAFYRLRDSTPFALVDLCVKRCSDPWTLTERERHGEPVVFFDKRGSVQVTSVDLPALRDRLRERVELLRAHVALFGAFVEKELLRGNDLGAFAFYQQMVHRPLHELLRIRHAPALYDFGLRYARRDLPADAAEALRELLFVRDADDLRAKQRRAEALFAATLAELEATDAG